MSDVFPALSVLTQLPYIILAITLGYVLTPAQKRLELSMSTGPASLTLTLTLTSLSMILLFILVAYVITIAIQQGLALVRAISVVANITRIYISRRTNVVWGADMCVPQ